MENEKAKVKSERFMDERISPRVDEEILKLSDKKNSTEFVKVLKDQFDKLEEPSMIDFERHGILGIKSGTGRYVFMSKSKSEKHGRLVMFINNIDKNYDPKDEDFVIMEFLEGKSIMKIRLSEVALASLNALMHETDVNFEINND